MRKNLTRQQIIRTLEKHQDILKKYKVKKIGLFGSFATGRQNQKSDIDLIVEFSEPSFDNFMGLTIYLENIFGKNSICLAKTSPVEYTCPQIPCF